MILWDVWFSTSTEGGNLHVPHGSQSITWCEGRYQVLQSASILTAGPGYPASTCTAKGIPPFVQFAERVRAVHAPLRPMMPSYCFPLPSLFIFAIVRRGYACPSRSAASEHPGVFEEMCAVVAPPLLVERDKGVHYLTGADLIPFIFLNLLQCIY